jgi:mitotic spindle assembly checkpoint protein MAD1
MDSDWKVVRDELTRQASYLRNLESSNARMSGELVQFRQRNESIEVLKEQKRDLERKVATTDALRQSVSKLEAEVEAARKEREEWCATSALLSRLVLTPVLQGIEDTCIRASCTHSRLGDPQSRQPATRTRAGVGGVWCPQSRSAAEGAGDT